MFATVGSKIMDDAQPLVLVVDDDESVRRSLRWLLISAGYSVATFSSGMDMLEHRPPEQPAVLLMDVRMPDMTGLEVKDQLSRMGRDIVTIFITGHDDVAISVQAMKSGAEDFLLKPFDETTVLEAVERGIVRQRARLQETHQVAAIGGRYETLTPREHEVCDRVVAGRLNKQIAAELGMCEQTVKVHRSRVMRKMNADSLADLVRSIDLFRRLSSRPKRTDSPVPLTAVVDGARHSAPAYTLFSHPGARQTARVD
jgi:FixJ family two-component response regulator